MTTYALRPNEVMMVPEAPRLWENIKKFFKFTMGMNMSEVSSISPNPMPR